MSMDTSKSKYIIRRISQSDNEIVRDIILSVMTDFGCIGDGFSSSDAELHTMYETYSLEGSAFFVIEDIETNQVLGCCGIGPLQGGERSICELKKMYFLPQLRGLGLGQMIIDTCMAAARKYGYQKCYLETLEAMAAANHLYHKNDFVKLKEPLGATGHNGCDAYLIKDL